MKPKKIKKYESGGSLDWLSLATNFAGNVAGALTHKADYNQDAYKVNWANVAGSAGVNLIPELIRSAKDKRQRQSAVLSASPGAYATGGPLDPTLPFLPLMQDPFLPTFTPNQSKPVATTVRQPRKGLLPSPKLNLPADYRPAHGNSSTHSKSKERFREYVTGGPIGGPGPDKTNTGFFGDDANVRPIRTPRNKVTKPLQFVGRYEDPNYQEKLLKSLSRETGWNSIKSNDRNEQYETIGEVNNYKFIRNSLGGSHVYVKDKTSGLFAVVPAEDYTALEKEFNLSLSGKKKKGYASGGMLDNSLSAESFEVQGNPNETDANYYPELNARLDHGEVVKNNFVYSNKLKDDVTGRTFAKLALPIEKSIGKSQKALMNNPNDEMAKKNIALAEKMMQSIAQKQEMLATAKGLRNKPTEAYYTGGPIGGPTRDSIPANIAFDPRRLVAIDPFYVQQQVNNLVPATPAFNYNPVSKNTSTGDVVLSQYTPSQVPVSPAFNSSSLRAQSNLPTDTTSGNLPSGDPVYMAVNVPSTSMGAGRGIYYDPYNQKFLKRDFTGSYMNVDYGKGREWLSSNASNIASHLQQYPGQTPATGAPMNNSSIADPFITFGNNQPTVKKPVATGTSRGPVPLAKSKPNKNSIIGTEPSGPVAPNANAYLDALITGKYRMPVVNQIPSRRTDVAKYFTEPDGTLRDISEFSDRAPMSVARMNTTNVVGPKTVQAASSVDPEATGSRSNNGFESTLGDILQGVEVASKFGQLIGGSEVETPYYDNTIITKPVYDPSQALLQNNRSYSSALRGLNAPSVNTRRAYANSMLASKLNADNQTLAQYNQMNRGALSDYENRTSNQRRFNISQTVGTNDMNARNRAAYKEAVDVAFNSLGNFGEALNAKKGNKQVLRMLKEIYPEVYKTLMPNG